MVLQWVIILALCLLVFSLVRQLGEITMRLNGEGKAVAAEPEPEKIFAPYTAFPDTAIPLFNGGTFQCGGKRLMPCLIVTYSPSCAACADLPDAVREFHRHIPADEFNLLVILKTERAAAQRYIEERGLGSLPIAVEGEVPEKLRVNRSPFAIGIMPGGAVAASGRPKNLTHLLEMAQGARAMAELTPSHSRRKHEWGESAPYWNFNGEGTPEMVRRG